MNAAYPPIDAVREIVGRALAEDLGPLGDITSVLLLSDGTRASADIVARSPGVLAGRLAATEVFAQVDPSVAIFWSADDGDSIGPGGAIAHVAGPLIPILTAERTALNLLGHLSGVATLTRRFVDTAGPHACIRDTRKTTPGLRALEKAAVRAGGGVNHRGSLSDGILLKDNHLAGISIADAVDQARRQWPGRTVEVECDDRDQLKHALAAGADMVLLDNMSPEQVAECVSDVAGSCLVEVSGGVTLDNVFGYAAAGADLISVGAITHSAPLLDIALDVQPAI